MGIAGTLDKRQNISDSQVGLSKMKNAVSAKTNIAIFCGLLTFLLSACRTPPVSPPAPSEPPPEAQKIEPPEAIPPEAPDDSSAKAKPEVIARLFPESQIAAPDRDLAARRVEYSTIINNRAIAPSRSASWRYRTTRQGQIVGFELSNQGGNRILPPRRDAVKNQFFGRDFQFRFDERARQDIHLLVSDWAPSRDRVFRLSELMNSLMVFFPRNFLPAIVNSQNREIVTLPTGEEVEFDSLSHEIIAGVLSEAPVDLNPDPAMRKFPEVAYHGKGITVRATSRGTDPRIGTTAVISTGTPPENCGKGILCKQCEVPSKDLWEQSGAVRFKFASDTDFDRFLISRCEFGLPKIGSEFAVAVPR